MRKEDADAIKVEFDSEPDWDDALQVMSQEALDIYLENLDFIEGVLGREVCDYSLDTTHDLLDDAVGTIIRSFWWSKGMEDHFCCIDGNGHLRWQDDAFPLSLLAKVSTTLNDLMGE